jgi:hypothetical protein
MKYEEINNSWKDEDFGNPVIFCLMDEVKFSFSLHISARGYCDKF